MIEIAAQNATSARKLLTDTFISEKAIVPFEVHVNGQFYAVNITYDPTVGPTVSRVEPSEISAGMETIITVHGANFDAVNIGNNQGDSHVHIGARVLKVKYTLIYYCDPKNISLCNSAFFFGGTRSVSLMRVTLWI